MQTGGVLSGRIVEYGMGWLSDFVRKGFPLRCSFCRGRAAEVERLVAGASGYICDACVAKGVAVPDQHKNVAPPGAAPI